MSKGESDWSKLPYFGFLAALALVSLGLYCVGLSNFWTELVPIYLTEALLFITIGLFFYYHKKSSRWSPFFVFLMGMMWLLNQAIVWGAAPGLSVIMWFLLILQFILAYLFFSDEKIEFLKPIEPKSQLWGYAALFPILFFAIGKIILNIAYSWSPAPWLAWGIAVLLTALGYVFQKYDWGLYLKLLGFIIGLISAITIAGPGLTLLG